MRTKDTAMMKYVCDECGWAAKISTRKLHPETAKGALNIKILRHTAQRHVEVTEPEESDDEEPLR